MLYELYEPLPELRPNIAAFWAQEKPAASFSEDILLPDSYLELIITIGPSSVWELETGEHFEVPPANLMGLQRQPLRVRARDDFRAIGIHLNAWGVRPLIGKQVNLEVPYLPLDDSWQQFAREIERIANHQGYAGAVDALQRFVLDKYRRSTIDVSPVRTAGSLLQASHGQLGIYDLADRCYISPSQLQRHFKEYMGVSPKTYARILRYEAIRKRLLADPTYPTLDLVDEFGYADQAHLIREFKAFTSQTPREFAAHAFHRPEQLQDAAFIQSL